MIQLSLEVLNTLVSTALHCSSHFYRVLLRYDLTAQARDFGLSRVDLCLVCAHLESALFDKLALRSCELIKSLAHVLDLTSLCVVSVSLASDLVVTLGYLSL